MSKDVWIGVDLAEKSFVVAWTDPRRQAMSWSKLDSRCFPSTAAGVQASVRWLYERGVEADGIAGVCVEAMGALAYRWVEMTQGRLGAVSLINPAWPRAFAQSLGIRDKTDVVDACVLAMYGQATQPQPRALPSHTQMTLKRLCRTYQDTQQSLQAWQNRLREPIASTAVRRQMRALLRSLERTMEVLEAEMDALLQSDERLRQDNARLQTIPGVAKKTARVVLAEFGDLRQFTRAELTAMAGLHPVQFQSGTSINRKPRIAKTGGRRARRGLYMAALVAKQHNPQLRRFAERLKRERNLAPKAIIAAVMRKLLLLMRRLIVSGTDYDAKHMPQSS